MRPRENSLVVNIILFFLYYTIMLAGGYLVTQFIYRFTGEPPAIIANILTGLAAVLLIIPLQSVILLFSRRVRNEREAVHNELVAALRKIAQGNFDISLSPHPNNFNKDLYAEINALAKNLGTLETMRQDFISNVSHEIQSPLTSISGFAALLGQDGLSDDERKHYAGVVEAESKRLSSLSENLLKMSNLDNNKIPLNRAEFRLDRQLEQVALTLEPQWTAKNINLEADLQKCTINGDAGLLSQVWMNLLHNAIKFTPDGGEIRITLTPDAKVTIADNGIGIAPDDQVHIFERFYKVDKARDRSLGGNGLGLSLVKKIVELYNGEITVKSELGRGTLFTVALPRECIPQTGIPQTGIPQTALAK